MGKKSNSTIPARQQSSAQQTSTASGVTNTSSILRSSFAPSTFQLQLFASVIQSFDCQHLRLHDTTTGRLRQQHAETAGTEITSLDWGYYGSSLPGDKPLSKKKRKRPHDSPEDVVLAYGTSTSEICMYSPSEGRVVGKLSGVHERSIRDFKFRLDDTTEAWSIGGDAKLAQWDLKTGKAIRTISLPDASTSILSRPSSSRPQIICASTQPFAIDCSPETAQIESYDAFKTPVHTILRSGHQFESSPEAFVAMDHDRYLNIFDIERRKLTTTLVVGSEVQNADLYSPTDSASPEQEQLLIVVTKDGIVELFPRPFHQQTPLNGDLKSKRKGMTRKAQAQIKLVVDSSKKPVSIYKASPQGSDIILVSVHGGVDPSFQRVRWQDQGTGDLLLEGLKEVQLAKSTSVINSMNMNGVKDMGKNAVDDSQTVLINGDGDFDSAHEAIEISSEEEDLESENGSEQEETKEADIASVNDEEAGQLVRQEESDSDEDMQDAEEDQAEPTFGDMLAAKHPETISIGNSLVPYDDTNPDVQQLAVPAGMSLGTVLTQALKSNDNNLLESCLHANDDGIIQNTIQRLDSSLAAILLSKLAERLASRPGRYGHLLSWVQWTCIAHGGIIAGQPSVVSKLKTLYRVLNQRSSSLDQLLLLRGKLDMLGAQLAYRKQLQAQRGALQDEPGMIYIEGEPDNWSSEDDHDEAPGPTTKKLGFKTKVPLQDLRAQDDSSSEDEEDMPTTNGILAESEDESDSEIDSTGRKKGILDVEAEVSGEEDSEDEGDDIDDEEEDDEDEDSSMADFINDGDSEESDENDEDETPKRPSTKRARR